MKNGSPVIYILEKDKQALYKTIDTISTAGYNCEGTDLGGVKPGFFDDSSALYLACSEALQIEEIRAALAQRHFICLIEEIKESAFLEFKLPGAIDFVIKNNLYRQLLPFYIEKNLRYLSSLNIKGHKLNGTQECGKSNYVKNLLETFSEPLFIKNEKLEYIEANENFCDFLGIDYDSLIGKTDYYIFPEAEAGELYLNDISALNSENAVEREEKYLDSDKNTHIVATRKIALDNPDSGERFLAGAISDVTIFKKLEQRLNLYKSRLEELVEERTVDLMKANQELEIEMAERQKVQESLQEANQMFELVMNSIPSYIFWKDRNLVFLGCNKKFALSAGFKSIAEVRGKTDYDMPWGQTDADKYRHDDMRIMALDRPEYHIIETQRTNGAQDKWLETNKAPLHDFDGKVVGILGTYEDITSRRETEIALYNSEKKYRKIFDTSPDAIVLLDKKGIVKDINNRVYEWLGYLPEEIVGNPILDMPFLPESQKPLARLNFENLLDKNSHAPYELTFRAKSGDTRVGWIFSSALKGESGEISEILIMVTEITERKKAEQEMAAFNKELEIRVKERTEQLQRAMKDLKEEIIVRKSAEVKLLSARDELKAALDKEKELNELKTRFISMISHEYRTPLTVILTSSYIIEKLYQGIDESEFSKYLDKIRASVESMIQLHDSVLTISRGEAHAIKTSKELFALNALLISCVEEAQLVEFQKHDYKISAETDISVNSDKNILKQIVSNLLLNASKYSPKGAPIELRSFVNGQQIEITVKDEGIGISEKDAQYLFEPFHRGANIGAVQGAGLGLSIVKQCVDALGGKISVKSELNSGSEFKVTLPT